MLWMITTVFSADLSCADVQAMMKAGKTEQEMVTAIKSATISLGDLECFRTSGLPVAVMSAIQAETPIYPSLPASVVAKPDQYECTLFSLPPFTSDPPNMVVNPVKLPEGWVPINGWYAGQAYAVSGVVLACRITP